MLRGLLREEYYQYNESLGFAPADIRRGCDKRYEKILEKFVDAKIPDEVLQRHGDRQIIYENKAEQRRWDAVYQNLKRAVDAKWGNAVDATLQALN